MHPLGFMAQFIPAGGHADPIIQPGQDGKGVSAQAESSGIKTLIMLKGDIFLAMMVRIRVMPGDRKSVV